MDSIFLLFEKVETKHGWPLVSHALAYVTAAKNGVSETELEDLISLDDKVLETTAWRLLLGNCCLETAALRPLLEDRCLETAAWRPLLGDRCLETAETAAWRPLL